MTRFIAVFIIVTMLPGVAAPQSAANADVWRDFAKQVKVGSALRVRLHNGQRFNAALVSAGDDALLLQPKTRRPVDVQRVAYDDVESLERKQEGGTSVGKAVAIGAGVGAGAFLGFLLLVVAAID